MPTPDLREPARAQADAGGLRALLTRRRDEILAVAACHGAGNVRVFGSVARGDHRSDSDVDLLVDFEPGRNLFDLGHLTDDLNRLLGVRVDVVSVSAHRPGARRVLDESVPL